MKPLKYVRACWRLLYFAVYTLARIAQILLSNLIFGSDLNRSMEIRRRWARHLLPAIGVRMHVRGRAPGQACLIMGNHRSYLDPIVLIHDTVAWPVSKAEVANWPIVGYGARMTGILFLQRESSASRKKTLQGIGEKIREGHSVLLFPEGTTHSELQCREFRPGGFKLAAQEKVPVLPVAIEYRSAADYWIGDDQFLPHFFRRFSEKNMEVFVSYGEPIESEDPEFLRETSRDWIDRELLSMRKSFKIQE